MFYIKKTSYKKIRQPYVYNSVHNKDRQIMIQINEIGIIDNMLQVLMLNCS